MSVSLNHAALSPRTPVDSARLSFPVPWALSPHVSTPVELLWTPALTCDTPGDLAVTYASRSGRIIKKGRELTVTGNLITSSFTHTTASGNALVSGFPYTANADANYGAACLFGGITKASYTQFLVRMAAGTSSFRLTASGTGVAASNVAITDMPTGGTVRIEFTLTMNL